MDACSMSSWHSEEQMIPAAFKCFVPELEMHVLVHYIKLVPVDYRKWNRALG